MYKSIIEIIAGTWLFRKLDQAGAISLYRNAFYLLSSNAIATASGFFFWLIAARLYSTTEVGFGSAIISAVHLITLISLIGLGFSIIRHLSRSPNPQVLINSSLTLGGLISLMVAVIFVVGTPLWSSSLIFVRSDAVFFVTLVAIAVVSTMSTVLGAAFVARRKAVYVLYRSTAASLLRIPLLLILAVFFHTFGLVTSWGMAAGIVLAISLLYFLPKVETGYRPIPTLNLSQLSSHRRFAAANYVASLVARAPMMILPIMVLNFLGTESSAYFYVAWMTSGILYSVSQSVSQSLFAEASHSQENVHRDVKRSLKFTFIILVPAVILLLAAGKWILLAFGSEYSTEGLGLLCLLGIAAMPRAVIQIYVGLLRSQDKVKEILAIRIFMAIAVLASSWYVIPEYGIIGIGYMWLSLQVLVLIAIVPRLISRANRTRRLKEEAWEDVDTL